MQTDLNQKNGLWQSESRLTALPTWCRRLRLTACLVAVALLYCPVVIGQASSPPKPRQSLLMPEANPMPDANDLMMMRQKNEKKQNFDAANTMRREQINDDSIKLLILTRDLKVQMDKLGNKPLTPRLLREIHVIEILAHDVQTKMKLTVGAG
jgi:hypothetical protein